MVIVVVINIHVTADHSGCAVKCIGLGHSNKHGDCGFKSHSSLSGPHLCVLRCRLFVEALWQADPPPAESYQLLRGLKSWYKILQTVQGS